MEEYIKILEDLINHIRFNEPMHYGISLYYKAIENLIKGYRELEEENEDLKNDLHHDGLAHKYLTLKATSIPKSKIKEKIEEIENTRIKGEYIRYKLSSEDIRRTIKTVLQELMEDK